MSKIKFTATYEIETEHALDSAKAFAFIHSFNDGGEINLEEATLASFKLIEAEMVTPLEEVANTTESEDDTPIETPAYDG